MTNFPSSQSGPSAASELGGGRAWLIYSLAAMAFGYAFFQRVAPSVMVSELMRDFAIGGALLGTLSALYFYPYVLLQVPLGALLDRFGARKLLSSALLLASFGSFVFATAETLTLAYIGRILIGIGSSVGFLASLALAARWFPANRFAFLSGLTMFFAMLSGVLAQGPLAAFVEIYGWRNSVVALAVVGFLLAVSIAVLVRNAPESDRQELEAKQSWREIGRALWGALTTFRIWKIAIAASALSGPMLALGALWGTPFLMTAYGLDRTYAASLSSLMLLSWAFGAPLSGLISDKIGRRRPLLITGASLMTLALAAIIFLPEAPLWLTVLMMMLAGLSGATMAVSFAFVKATIPQQLQSSALGIVNSMTVASGALLQPVVGLVLDFLWGGQVADGARIYLPQDYRIAFISVLFVALLGLAMTLSLRED